MMQKLESAAEAIGLPVKVLAWGVFVILSVGAFVFLCFEVSSAFEADAAEYRSLAAEVRKPDSITVAPVVPDVALYEQEHVYVRNGVRYKGSYLQDGCFRVTQVHADGSVFFGVGPSACDETVEKDTIPTDMEGTWLRAIQPFAAQG